MAEVVRLETAVDLDVREDGSSPGDLDPGRQGPLVPSELARPGLAPAPRPVRDPREVSVSATLSAVLDDGRRLPLLERGWASTGHWDTTTVTEIEDTARTVVGPDEPAEGQTSEEVAAAHWAHLAALLSTQDVIADPGMPRSLRHDVVLSARLRARIGRA